MRNEAEDLFFCLDIAKNVSLQDFVLFYRLQGMKLVTLPLANDINLTKRTLSNFLKEAKARQIN